MKIKPIALILPTLLVGVTSAATVLPQNEPQTRSITSDDFSKRPVREASGKAGRPGSKAGGAAIARKKPAEYTFVRKDKTPIRWNAGVKVRPKPAPTKKPTLTTDIGVTIWKLRPRRGTDSGVTLPVWLKDVDRREMWTPERVAADAAFHAGDRIRMAIESPARGFLYIINSEMNADGSLGVPHLIFPDPVSQDNGVGPGMLVDVPDQNEDLPYFTIDPTTPTHSGELLAIIISKDPIAFSVDDNRIIRNPEVLAELQTDVDFEVFGRIDTDDGVFTQAEADAACGSKTRELVREQATLNPCGTKSRQLTRDEPQPQAIYRVKTQAGRPAVAIIRLSAR